MSARRRLVEVWCRVEWQAKVVALASLMATVYVQLAIPLYWGGGDPLDHLRIARYIVDQPEGMYIPWRPPGMALYMILVGVTRFETFDGLVASYAVMAFAIPLLAYQILRQFDRNAAMLAGMVTIVTGFSTAFSRNLWPEQLFHFLHFIALAQIASWFGRPGSRWTPYTIAITVFAMNLVRPVAALYYWIFLGCAVLMVRRPIRHVLIASLMYTALNGGWALVDRYYGASTFPLVYPPTTPEQRSFAEFYYSSENLHFVDEHPPEPLIRREDGEYSARLCDALEWYVHSHPQIWGTQANEMPYLLFGRFAGRPDDLVRAVLSRPNFAYFNFLRTALYAKYGTHGAEKVMRRVAREHGHLGFRGVLRYFGRRPGKLLTGGMPSFAGRNLLGLFYYTKQRREAVRFYSSVWGTAEIDPELYRQYRANPTKETLEALRSDDQGLRLILPENGPATREFLGATELMVRAYPMYWENTNSWFSPYKGRPDEFLAQVLDPDPPVHSGIFEAFYWDALLKYYGIERADQIYSQAATEALRRYPYSGTIVLDNAIRIMFIRTIGDLKSPPSPLPYSYWGDLAYVVRRNDTTGLSPSLAAALQDPIEGTAWSDVLGKAYAIGHLTSPLFVIAAIATFLPAYYSPARRVTVFLALAYLYNVAVISVFGNFGCPRYSDVFHMLPVLLTCLGGTAVAAMRRRWRLEGGGRTIRGGGGR